MRTLITSKKSSFRISDQKYTQIRGVVAFIFAENVKAAPREILLLQERQKLVSSELGKGDKVLPRAAVIEILQNSLPKRLLPAGSNIPLKIPSLLKLLTIFQWIRNHWGSHLLKHLTKAKRVLSVRAFSEAHGLPALRV